MKIYNTLTRQIEEFKPYREKEVKLYTCGPTVYNFAHIGNLRTYINEDILHKGLRYKGYDVKHCMNITDVGHLESDDDFGEDKMLKGAKRENKTVWEIAQMYTDAFFEDCAKLNIQRPEIVVKATDLIDHYIKFIQELEKKGFTYFAGGNVYFDVSKFPEYNKLSKMPLEDLIVANREGLEVDPNKRNHLDFVLWFTKSKFENQAMKWDSPWGVGYPGWHIECSVISLVNLGDELDIHCGGVDHIPIHHTNEIAQSEAYLGKEWCKYWWHGEFLIDQSGKMSKSNNEFLTVSLLEKKGYMPLAYRYYVLNSHYRKQLVFSFDRLDEAQNAYIKLRKRIDDIMSGAQKIHKDSLSQTSLELLQAFGDAIGDDFNTPNAMTVLYDVLKADISNSEKAHLIGELDSVLSLDLTAPYMGDKLKDVSEEFLAWIEAKIDERARAKQQKNWALADAIREELTAKNIVLKDSKTGTTWEIQ